FLLYRIEISLPGVKQYIFQFGIHNENIFLVHAHTIETNTSTSVGAINMCGIVGAVGQHDITPILLEGLKRLEYRGYDSCGVAVHAEGQLRRARSTQRVA